MTTQFSTNNTTAPFGHAVAVTPSDVTILRVTDALLVGTAGNLAVRTASGSTLTMAVPVGVLAVSVDQVLATGTTAAGVTALYRNY